MKKQRKKLMVYISVAMLLIQSIPSFISLARSKEENLNVKTTEETSYATNTFNDSHHSGLSGGNAEGRFEFAGKWDYNESNGLGYNKDIHTTDESGASYSVRFFGEGIHLYLPKTTDGGIAEIIVDNGEAERIDLYSTNNVKSQLVYKTENLKRGPHTLTVTCTGEKNKNSSGTMVSADRVDVLDDILQPYLPYGRNGQNPLKPVEILHTSDQIKYIGNWSESNEDHYIGFGGESEKGARATVSFYGTRIEMINNFNEKGGIASVQIDGGKVEEVSIFEASEGVGEAKVSWTSEELEFGNHTLTITYLGKKDPDNNVTEYACWNVRSFKVYGNKVPPIYDDWNLVWNDEFDGTELDRSKWDPWWCDWDGQFQFPDGEQLNKVMYTDDGVSLSNGILKVASVPIKKNIGAYNATISSCLLSTKYTYAQTYGYMEIRFRCQPELDPVNNPADREKHDGLAFWTMPADGMYGLGGNGVEIDIIEHHDPDGGKSNTFWGGYGNPDATTGGSSVNNWSFEGLCNGDFHIIGCDWTQDSLKFYCDGELVMTITGESVPTGPEFLCIQNGRVDSGDAYSEVDYVRCYLRPNEGYTGRKTYCEGDVTVNGDFESEKDMWNTEYGENNINKGSSYEGENCMELLPDSAVKQVLGKGETEIVPYSKYQVRAKVKLENLEDKAYIEINKNAVDNKSSYFDKKSIPITGTKEGYQEITFDFVMGAYLKAPELYLKSDASNSGNVYFDNIEVIGLKDIALSGIASASSIWENVGVENVFYEAQKAVDGFENSGVSAEEYYDEVWRASSTKWMSKEGDINPWLMVDLKEEQTIARYEVRHAGAYEKDAVNTKDFEFQVSNDGKTWQTLDTVTENVDNITERNVNPTKARYVRLNITDIGADVASIYEFSVYDEESQDIQVSKEKLKNLVQECEAFVEEEYTSESWNVLQRALDAAYDVLENPNTTQEEVNAAYDVLQKSYRGLIRRADKNALINAVKDAESIWQQKDIYIPSTIMGMDELIKDANIVLNDPDVLQSTVDDMTQKLIETCAKVRVKEDKTNLLSAIKQGEQIDAKLYTEESYAKLANALKSGKEIVDKDEASKEEIENAAKAIYDAIQKLVKISDTTEQIDKINTEKIPETGDNSLSLMNLLLVLMVLGIGGSTIYSRRSRE